MINCWWLLPSILVSFLLDMGTATRYWVKRVEEWRHCYCSLEEHHWNQTNGNDKCPHCGVSLYAKAR
jgi:hypothetical protein